MHGKGDEALVDAVDGTTHPPELADSFPSQGRLKLAASYVVIQFKPALAIPYAGAM
jgi:hypothetical protein